MKDFNIPIRRHRGTYEDPPPALKKPIKHYRLSSEDIQAIGSIQPSLIIQLNSKIDELNIENLNDALKYH